MAFVFSPADIEKMSGMLHDEGVIQQIRSLLEAGHSHYYISGRESVCSAYVMIPAEEITSHDELDGIAQMDSVRACVKTCMQKHVYLYGRSLCNNNNHNGNNHNNNGNNHNNNGSPHMLSAAISAGGNRR